MEVLSNNIRPNESIVLALKGEVILPKKNLPNFVSKMKDVIENKFDASGVYYSKLCN